MKKADTILDDLHNIRREIFDDIKSLSSSERTAYFRKVGEDMAAKYGIKRYSSVDNARVGIAISMK